MAHRLASGTPTTPGLYYGYFENRYGEQFVFTFDRATGTDIARRSSGEEDSRSLKPFRWNPAGNQSRPVEPDQQPEASLAWWVGDHPCEA